MAETIKTTHRRAKGKTDNGKPGGPTVRRPRATTRLIRKGKKAPPAQAKKKQARSVNQAASVVFVRAETRAADLLNQGAEKYIKENWAEIIEGLGKGACEGHPMNARTLKEWAVAKPPVPSNSPDRAALVGNLGKIHSEPEYPQPEDRGARIHQEASDLPEDDAATLAT